MHDQSGQCGYQHCKQALCTHYTHTHTDTDQKLSQEMAVRLLIYKLRQLSPN